MRVSWKICIALVCVLILVGCHRQGAVEENVMGSDEIKEHMLEQLNRKYSREFEAIQFTPKNFFQDFYEMKVCEVNGDKRTDAFYAQYTPGKDSPYMDGYFNILVRDEVEQIIATCLNQYITEYKVFIKGQSSFVDSSLTHRSSFADARALGELHTINIYVFHTGDAIGIDGLIEELKKQDIYGRLFYCCMKNFVDYEQVERSNCAKVMNQMDENRENAICYEKQEFMKKD